jgi:hypothetical protein
LALQGSDGKRVDVNVGQLPGRRTIRPARPTCRPSGSKYGNDNHCQQDEDSGADGHSVASSQPCPRALRHTANPTNRPFDRRSAALSKLLGQTMR